MLEWISENIQLVAMAKLFLSNEDIDLELLDALLNKAEKDRNHNILIMMVNVAVSNYADGHKDLVSRLLLPAVRLLGDFGDSNWIKQVWYRKELKDILPRLGEEEREVVFNSLLVAPDIEYHAEELLVPLAAADPKRVLAFFEERLEREKKIKPIGRYDAIPFQFHKLHKVLAKFPDLTVDTVRHWFDGDVALFQYHGANLLKIIYPAFPEEFEAKLLELVQSGKTQDIGFVLSVLQNYEGQTFLHNVCRAIVAELPENDKLLTTVVIVLQSTGVVMGEFGFAEAYERKTEEIRPWLTDQNDKVRRFAENYIRNLERQAESERQRAEEELEVRKHVYGVRRAAAEANDDVVDNKGHLAENGE